MQRTSLFISRQQHLQGRLAPLSSCLFSDSGEEALHVFHSKLFHTWYPELLHLALSPQCLRFHSLFLCPKPPFLTELALWVPVHQWTQSWKLSGHWASENTVPSWPLASAKRQWGELPGLASRCHQLLDGPFFVLSSSVFFSLCRPGLTVLTTSFLPSQIIMFEMIEKGFYIRTTNKPQLQG